MSLLSLSVSISVSRITKKDILNLPYKESVNPTMDITLCVETPVSHQLCAFAARCGGRGAAGVQ